MIEGNKGQISVTKEFQLINVKVMRKNNHHSGTIVIIAVGRIHRWLLS